jgi:hypothetical protein
MITKKIKALEEAKAKVQQLEAAVSRGLHSALASLPDEYGFESVDAFISAVKSAAGVRSARPAKGAGAKARRTRAKITDAVRKDVVRLVKAGKTGLEIAAAIGISLPSVQNIKKAAGLVKTAPKAARRAAKPAAAKKKPAGAAKPRKKAAKPKSTAPAPAAAGPAPAEATPAPAV